MKLVKIEKSGRHPTWDIEVKNRHCYQLENGAVSHNTIGLLMDCETTGIEPDYSLVKFKKLAGGGTFKVVNSALPSALKSLGYTQLQIKDVENWVIGHGELPEWGPIGSYTLKQYVHLNDEQIYRLNKQLKSSFDIRFVFNGNMDKDILDCFRDIRIDNANKQAPIPDDFFSMIPTVKKQDIADLNTYVCGSMTVEGAPHLKEEHLAVFDCANTCGTNGTRFLSTDAHLRMLAAAQPFLSGSSSKTINMPNSATIQDVWDVYMKAWTLGLKAVALYRDGSKLSQPLMSALVDPEPEGDEEVVEKTIHKKVVELAVAATNKIVMNSREMLPSKRRGYTQKAKVGNHNVYIRTGEYPDGRLGEIFLDISKEGSALRAMTNNFAIAISLGLQYGVPLDEYVGAFTFTKFEPSGPVRGHDRIKNATSIVDLVFRDLAINYLGRNDLAHVSPEELDTNEKPNQDDKDVVIPMNKGNGISLTPGVYVKEIDVAEFSVIETAKSFGYEGEACPECHNFTLVRNGTCLKCVSCGSTTGCS